MRSPPLAEADVLPDPELTPFVHCYNSFQGWVTPSLMVGGTGQGGVEPATGNTEPTVLDWATPSLAKQERSSIARRGDPSPPWSKRTCGAETLLVADRSTPSLVK